MGKASGRFKGRGEIAIRIDSVDYNGQFLPLTTALDAKVSPEHKERDIAFIGGGRPSQGKASCDSGRNGFHFSSEISRRIRALAVYVADARVP